VETFRSFSDGIPDGDKASWEKFCEFIYEEMSARRTVFTAVHQNMGWDRFQSTINEVMRTLPKLCQKLEKSKTLEDCFLVLKGVQNVGPFFAWQILCDLTEAGVVDVNDIDQWAALGPGAKKGINIVFQNSSKDVVSLTRTLTKITAEAVRSGWISLSLPSPLVINCKMVEHALCEFSKYVRFASQGIDHKPFVSRAIMDNVEECVVCASEKKSSINFFCLLCNRKFHQDCIKDPSANRVSFLCSDCAGLVNK